MRNNVGILFVLFCNLSIFGGFSAGTLVKVVHGYVPIEQLRCDDSVICYTVDQGYVENVITHRVVYTAHNCIALIINQKQIVTARDQRFYVSHEKKWKKASQLQVGDVLFESDDRIVAVEDVCILDDPVDLYDISVKDYHNFLVLTDDIVVHNFVPFFLGLSWAFGLGSVEFMGASVGGAFLGGILGFKLHKNKQTKKYQVTANAVSGGFFPNDPEEDRNKKREAQRALTNEEARRIAKELGYKEVKGLKWSTHNELTFQKGNKVISPDNTCHKGGVWKMFSRAGKRLSTWNINLTKMIGG